MNKKDNPIQAPLMEIFGKLNYLNGLVFVACSQMKNFSKLTEQIISRKSLSIDLFGAGASLVVRDLTEWPENGWVRNYASGGFHRKGQEYLEASHEIERVLATFAFAQAYEAFETFLLDMGACYLHQHPSEARSSHKSKFDKKPQFKDLNPERLSYWQKYVRFINRRGRNNKEIMKILRDLAPELAKGEGENNRCMDLQKWFSVASAARHAATHSWGELREDYGKAIPETDKKYFPTESKGNRRFLRLNYEQARNCLQIFADYAFLIFKCLSGSAAYDWNIFERGFKTILPDS